MRKAALFCSAVTLALAVASPSLADSLNRNVRIINETSFHIVEFYGSHVGTDSWQEDILGSDVLYSGQSVVIDFNDGTGYCMFDFKAVFNDGDEVVSNRINVCELESYRYHD